MIESLNLMYIKKELDKLIESMQAMDPTPQIARALQGLEHARIHLESVNNQEDTVA